MKKLVSITIAISMLLYTYTIAYADTTDYIPEWLDFVVDSTNTILGYSGSDVAFNSYLQGTAKAAEYGAMLQALQSIDTTYYDSNSIPITPYNSVWGDVANAGEGYLAGRYRSALVNRDFVNQLYTFAGGYGENNRYRSLDYYHITLDGDYLLSGIDYVGGNFIAQDSSHILGYYDLTDVKNTTCPVIVNTPYTPPILYTGTQSTGAAYHYGVKLVNDQVYFLIDDTCLITNKNTLYPTSRVYVSSYIQRYGNNLKDVRLSFISGNTVADSTRYPGYFDISGGTQYSYTNRVYNGRQETYADSNSMLVLDTFEKYIGMQADIQEVTIAPPNNIPYDSNGNVVINLSLNDNDDITYKTITYTSPNVYKTYYDDGDITNNTYTYNNDSSVVNNVINNYNYYIDNGGSSGGGGGSFDDSNILGKLDVIIGKLNDIIDTIKNISTSDVPGVKIFSSTPIYVDFGDCVTQNVGLASDIERINDSIDVTQSERVDGYIDRFKGEYTDTDDPYNGLFDDITINTDWYEPYRIRVRNILKIPCWIFAIFGSWAVIKSVFGVKE